MDQRLREELVFLLETGNAHLSFEKTVEGFPRDRIGIRPAGSPHSAWELLEHLRLAQNDLLRFSLSSDYPHHRWPEDYWPASPAPADPAEWDGSVEAYLKDRQAFVDLVRDAKRDLYEKFPWGEGQTVLREALVLADHNSYHIGQLLTVRRSVEAQ